MESLIRVTSVTQSRSSAYANCLSMKLERVARERILGLKPANIGAGHESLKDFKQIQKICVAITYLLELYEDLWPSNPRYFVDMKSQAA